MEKVNSESLLKRKGKRKTHSPCPRCFLNLNYCICECFAKIKTRSRVDLVVHCKELKRTTNTGRLIAELLENQKVWVRGIKNNPLDCSKILLSDHSPMMLYPSDDAEELSSDFLAKTLNLKPIQLIVPDGNWRQASKVHYRVEAFKGIPRVRLPGALADRVDLVRKETKASGMSTLESIGYAMGFLESSFAQEHILQAYYNKKKATLKARGEK